MELKEEEVARLSTSIINDLISLSLSLRLA